MSTSRNDLRRIRDKKKRNTFTFSFHSVHSSPLFYFLFIIINSNNNSISIAAKSQVSRASTLHRTITTTRQEHKERFFSLFFSLCSSIRDKFKSHAWCASATLCHRKWIFTSLRPHHSFYTIRHHHSSPPLE